MDRFTSILVVDDHADTARAMSTLLKRHGYAVDTAGSVGAAVEAAGHRNYGLLLCDLTLPDGDGCQVLDRIRSLYPLRAIAVTGADSDEDVRRIKDGGFDRLVVKPFDFDQLLSDIREVCD